MGRIISILIFVFGTIIGSFLNVVIFRLPNQQPIVISRSICPHCQQVLKSYHMVPIISYFLLGGKCAFCREKISFRYILVECLNGLIYLGIYLNYGLTFEMIALSFLFSVLLVMSFIDYDTYLIPNKLVVFGILGGMVVTFWHLKYGYNVYYNESIYNGIIGMFSVSGFLLIVTLVTMFFYEGGGIGMGDVKILMPIGLFLGWQLTFVGLWIAAILGGIVGILLIITGKRSRKEPMPFGPAIALGMYIVALNGKIIIQLLY